MGKQWWKSKTLWVNVLAIVALVIQEELLSDWIDIKTQMGILAVVNLILRIVTGKTIQWKRDQKGGCLRDSASARVDWGPAGGMDGRLCHHSSARETGVRRAERCRNGV